MQEKIKPVKALGQNFLNDKNIIKKIVASLDIQKNENILEVGPGMGALTGELLEQNINYLGIEIDERAYKYLQNEFENIALANVDFLKYNIQFENYKIIGNLPYYITSSILFKIFELENKPSKCIFMVQKEVAQRIAAKPGTKDNGILAILTDFVGEPKKLFDVSPNCFYPRPRVWSSIIEINFSKKYIADFKEFAKFVKTAFNQRRKRLSNSLKIYGSLPDEFAGKRPEQLNCEEFVELFDKVNVKQN